MNRKRKFRIWDGEKMYYLDKDNTLILTWKKGGWSLWRLKRVGKRVKEKLIAKEFGRKSFVIMEYTGFKDRRGNEIWEGDIIGNWDVLRLDIIPKGYIEWRENGFILVGNGWIAEPKYYKNGGIVLGNIYENPDLIKQIKKGG